MTGVLSFARKAYNTTVRSLFRRFVSRYPTPPRTSSTNSLFISILSPFETYVVSLQSLLIWERPYISAVSFVLLNCLFWLVVSWNRRFISILSLIILGIYVYRVWINQIWPEIKIRTNFDDSEDWIRVHPKVLSVPELGHYFNDIVDKGVIWWKDMMKLRQANHGLFCLLGCAAFSLLALIGHAIPGVLIIYGLVLALSLGPGIVLHLIPATIYDQIAGLFMEEDGKGKAGGSKKSCDNDSDLDEFLPEQSVEMMKQLSIAQDPIVCGLSSLTADEEEQDEHHLTTIRELGMDSFVSETEESSLYTGLGGFPSVEEENESDLEEEEEEEILLQPPVAEPTGIHFVPTHFKEDSSESESDAVFTEGLSFKNVPDIKEEPAVEGTTQDLPDNKKKEEDAAAVEPKVSTSSDIDEELMDFEILDIS